MDRLEIESWLKAYGIRNYIINEDMSVDVTRHVYLVFKELTKIPIKFRNVSGHFNCKSNKLTSLEGCPQVVGGDFNCSYNELTNLDGCPKKVGRDFNCIRNNLSTLLGGLVEVGRDFDCSDNNLISLDGCPESVGGDFDYFGNDLLGDQLFGLSYNQVKVYLQNKDLKLSLESSLSPLENKVLGSKKI